MYRFILIRHCGLDPQSTECYEIPRQARNDEKQKIHTQSLIPLLVYKILKKNKLKAKIFRAVKFVFVFST